MTNDLKERLYFDQNPITEHSKIPFTKRYKCYYLVYYERFDYVGNARDREVQLKKWSRIKKEKLISDFNPFCTFLNDEI